MALRVLLADESTTIKRVMQLALQDFAVEVKAVPIGIDVLPVTKAFKPDIIFADVLLPKKSGYEVGKELKKDPETKNIPLVLMWSGFMELDQVKAKESMAERRLENPFEPETLRALITELVKKTQTNPISSYLKFPEMPDFTEAAPATSQSIPDDNLTVNTSSVTNTNSELTSFTSSRIFSLEADKIETPNDIPSIDIPDDEEFAQVPLHKTAAPEPNDVDPKPYDPSEDWAHQDLSKFKIDVPTEDEFESPTPQFSIESETPKKKQTGAFEEFEEIDYAKAPTQGPGTSSPAHGTFNQEAVFREEARKVIESIAWKILPEITERIVREEINKLLQDTEKSISVP